MDITSAIFSKEILASKLLSFVLLDRYVFFFLLHQMEGGKGEDEGRGTVVGLSPCGSLVGAIH